MRDGWKLSAAATVVAAVVLLIVPGSGMASAGHFNCNSGTCTWGYNYIDQNLNNPLDAGWAYWKGLYSDHPNGGSYDIGWATQANGYWCKTTMGPMSSVSVSPSVWGCGGYLFEHTVWDDSVPATPYMYAEVNQ